MPLILITGYPTSGKTHRAKQLANYLQSRLLSSSSSTTPPPPPTTTPTTSSPAYTIHNVTDTALSIPRTVYDLSTTPSHARSANASEKDARAKVNAEVKKLLGKKSIVIVDAAGGNYIKGWRYQLYCEARAVGTGSCVVHVGASRGEAEGVNLRRLERRRKKEEQSAGREESEAAAARFSSGEKEISGSEEAVENGTGKEATDAKVEKYAGQDAQNGGSDNDDDDEEEPYDPSTWDNLVFRYEEPSPHTRWDTPLFTIPFSDGPSPPLTLFSDIYTTLLGTSTTPPSIVKPHQATVLRKAADENHLYELDKRSQEVVSRIVEWQRLNEGGVGGGEVDCGNGVVVRLPVGETVGLAGLQRLRRAWVGVVRGRDGRGGMVDVERVRAGFAEWLNGEFEGR